MYAGWNQGKGSPWGRSTMTRSPDQVNSPESKDREAGFQRPSAQEATRKAVDMVIGGGHPPPTAGRRVVLAHRPRPRRPLLGGAGLGGRKHCPELARAAPYLGRWFSVESTFRSSTSSSARASSPARVGCGRAASQSGGGRLRAPVVTGLGRWVPVRRGVRPDAATRQGRPVVWIPEPQRGELKHSLRR